MVCSLEERTIKVSKSGADTVTAAKAREMSLIKVPMASLFLPSLNSLTRAGSTGMDSPNSIAARDRNLCAEKYVRPTGTMDTGAFWARAPSAMMAIPASWSCQYLRNAGTRDGKRGENLSGVKVTFYHDCHPPEICQYSHQFAVSQKLPNKLESGQRAERL
jgi:hypothetical protein